MILGMMLPVSFLFLYSDRLGYWCWIILLLYSTALAILIYSIIQYRDLMGIRGYFTEEEFKEEYRREFWWIRIMDRIKGFRTYQKDGSGQSHLNKKSS